MPSATDPGRPLASAGVKLIDQTARGAQRLRVDAEVAAHAAGALLDGSLGLGETAARLLSELDIDAGSLGSLAGAAPVFAAHQRCVDGLSELMQWLRESLEGDADRLYQVAFAVAEADRNAADRMAGTGAGTAGAGSAGR